MAQERRAAGGRAGAREAGLSEAGAAALLTLAALGYGASFAAAKPLVAVLEPAFVAAARYVAVAGLLFAFLAWRGERLAVARAELLPLAAVGLLGFGLYQGLWGVSLALTTASNAAVLMATAPIFGAGIAAARGERVPPLAWAGVALAFFGVFLLMNRGLGGLALGGPTLAGDALWLANAALWALFTVASRPLIARHGALKVAAWTALLGAGPLFLLTLPFALDDPWAALGLLDALCFAFLAAYCGAFAQFAYNAGIGRLGAARAIVFMYLVPAFGVAVAVLALGESFGLGQAAGAAAVLAGVALAQRR